MQGTFGVVKKMLTDGGFVKLSGTVIQHFYFFTQKSSLSIPDAQFLGCFLKSKKFKLNIPLRSKGSSDKSAKLHTMAASNNSD